MHINVVIGPLLFLIEERNELSLEKKEMKKQSNIHGEEEINYMSIMFEMHLSNVILQLSVDQMHSTNSRSRGFGVCFFVGFFCCCF